MSRQASPAWNSASRQGWQLFAALVPCAIAVISLQPNTIPLITSALLTAFLCVISIELINRRISPHDTRGLCGPLPCFNALLLALSLSLFVNLEQATGGDSFAWDNQINTLHFLIARPVTLGAIAGVIAFWGISPLYSRREAGPFSLSALTLALTLILTELSRETDTITSPPVLVALILGACWLCWLRLLRLLPIAVFAVVFVGAWLASEPESALTDISKHLGALIIMPLFIGRLELTSDARNQNFVAGFIAGIVYCHLTLFSVDPYSPLFSLCIATLFMNTATPYLATLFIRAKSRKATTGLAIAVPLIALSALVLLRWLARVSETAILPAADFTLAPFTPLVLALLALILAGFTRVLFPYCRRWLIHRHVRRREAIASSGQTVLRARVTGVLHARAKE